MGKVKGTSPSLPPLKLITWKAEIYPVITGTERGPQKKLEEKLSKFES